MIREECGCVYKKYAKDTVLASISNIMLNLKGFILLPLLTKTLDIEQYGIWSLISATIALILPLALLQLNQSMTRFLAAEEDKNKISEGISSIFLTVFLSGTAFSLAIFTFAKPIAINIFGGVNAEPFIKITSAVLLITIADQVVSQYFRAFRQMKRYSFFTTLQTIIEVVLIYFSLYAGLGLSWVLYSLLVARAFTFIVGFLMITSDIRMIRPHISLIKSYLAFSIPLLPFMLCAWIVAMSDRYIIGHFMNIDAVGVYSACYVIGSIGQIFIYPLWIVLFPATTNLYDNNQISELRAHLQYSLKYFLMFAIPTSFGLLVLSKSLLLAVTTPKFVEGYLIIPIVAVGGVVFSTSTILGNTLMLVKRTKILSLSYTISAIVNIALNMVLVPSIGIIGAAIATLITFIVHLIVIAAISLREFSFDVDVKFIIKSCISSSIMCLIIFIIKPISINAILGSIVLGAAIYFLVLIFLSGFTKKEYTFLRNMI